MTTSNTTIKLKKSLISGNTPSSLANGEIALNAADAKLFYSKPDGTVSYITNQKSFDAICVDTTLILASSGSDTLNFVSGANVALTACTLTKTITISAFGEGGGGGGGGGSANGNIGDIQFVGLHGTFSSNPSFHYDLANNWVVADIISANIYGGIDQTSLEVYGSASSINVYGPNTGSDHVTIYSANTGTIDNMSIGLTVAANAKFIEANTNVLKFADGTYMTTAVISDSQFVRDTANTANFASANTIYIQGVDSTQNTRISTVEANTVYLFGALNQTNTNIGLANTQLKSYTDGAISSAVSSANTQLKSYTDGIVTSANTQLKAYTDGAISSANTQLKSYTDGLISSSVSSANTQLKSYVDGQISYVSVINATQNNSIQSAWNTANNALPLTGGVVSGDITANNLTANLAVYTPILYSPGGTSSIEMSDIGIIGINPSGGSGAGPRFVGKSIQLNSIYGGSYDGNFLSLNNETKLGSNRYDTVQIVTGTDGTINNTWSFANSHLIFPDNTWQNTAFTDAYVTQINSNKANTIYTQGVDTTQNTRITTTEANTVYLFGALNQTNTNIGLANTQLKSYTDGAITSANTQLKSYVDGQISYVSGVDATQNTRLTTVEANTVYLFGALNQTNTNIVLANTQLKSYTDGAIGLANTQLKSYVDGQVSTTLSYVSGIDTEQNNRISTVESNTIYLFGALNATNTNITNANTQLKSYTDGAIASANTQLKSHIDGQISYVSNVNTTQNTRLSTVESNTTYLFGALDATNNSIISANTQLKSYTDGLVSTSVSSANTQLKSYTDGAISSANNQLKSYVDGQISYNQGIDNTQNTRLLTVEANTVYLFGALNATNNSIISANTQLQSYTDGAISSAVTSANTQLKSYTDGAISSSVSSANTQLKSYVDGVISSSNTQLQSYVDGQISYVNNINNTQNTNITTATNLAQGAYNTANLKFNTSGGNITGDVTISANLTITGNLTVSGIVTTVSSNNLILKDNMIYLNDDNNVANPDLGFAGNYNDGTYHHAGFFRDHSDGIWKVFDNYKPEPDASPYIDTSNATFRIADFQANTVTFGKISTSSTQLVTNLNADYLNGQHGSYYAVDSEQNGINATQNTNITNTQTWLDANIAYISGVNTAQNSSIVNANTQLKAYTDGLVSSSVSSANTQLKAYTDGAISSAVSSANTQLQSYTDGVISSSVSSANTQLKSYTDGQISYVSSVDTTQNTRLNTVEANTVYLFGALNATNTNIGLANTQLKSYTDGIVTLANTQLKSYTDGAISSSVTSANTQLKSYTDGFISYISGVDIAQNTRISTVEANTVYLFGALNQTNTNIGLANTQLKAYTDGLVSSANTQLKSYTDGIVTSANTQLKSYTDGAISSANTQLKAYTDGAISSSVTSANTQLKAYTDGQISYVSGVDTTQNTSISALQSLANTDVTSISVTATTYGNSSYIPVTTLTANGRVLSVTNTAISIPGTAVTSIVDSANVATYETITTATTGTYYPYLSLGTSGNNIAYSNSAYVFDVVNGRMGISNTTPTVSLTVGGSIRVTNLESQSYESTPGAFVVGNIGTFVRNENDTTTTTARFGTINQPKANNQSGAATSYGTYNGPIVSSTTSVNAYGTYNNIIRGGNNPYDTGTAGFLYGTFNNIRHLYDVNANTSIVTGSAYTTYNAQTFALGSLNNSYSVYNAISLGTNAAASANITNFYGSYLTASIGAAAGANTSTITNYYGAYYGAPQVASSGRITNRYAIYSSDPASNTFFQGPIYSANTITASTIIAGGVDIINYVNSSNTQLKAYVDGQVSSTLSYVSGVDTSQNTRLTTVEANTVYLFGALNQTNTNIALANTQLKSYTDGIVTSANTQLKSYTDDAISSSVSSANTQLKSYVDGQVSSTLSYVSGVDNSQNTRITNVEANTVYLFGALNATNTSITNANTQLKAYTDGAIALANTQLKSYVDGQISYVSGVDTSQNTSITALQTLANTDYTTISVTATTYGNSSYIPVTTLAANGRVLSVTNTAISIPGTAVTSIVSSANVSTYDSITTATTGTYYPQLTAGVSGNNQSYANNAFVFDITNGRLGISNTSPTVALTVGGSVRVANLESQAFESVAGTTSNYNIGTLVRNENDAATSTIRVGTLNQPKANNQSGAATAYGTYNTPIVSSNTSVVVYGNYTLIDRGGNNPYDTATTGTMVGTYNNIRHLSHANANTSISSSTLYATYNNINCSVGSVTNAYGTYNRGYVGYNSPLTLSTITNYYGTYTLFAAGSGVGPTGTLTNYFGAYFDTPLVGTNGVITNKYAIYSADVASNTFFQGPIYSGNTITASTIIAGGVDVINYVNSANTQLKSYTDGQISYGSGVNTSQNTSISALQTLANTDYTTISVTAGDYGSATIVPVIKLAANGRISSISNTNITAGATITDDTTTNASRYVMLGQSTSGSYTVANTSSTKLTYNPSTGTLSATAFVGNGAGLTGISAGATITDDTTTNATRYIMLGQSSSGSYLVANTSTSKLYFNPSTGTTYSTLFQSLSDETQKTNLTPIVNATDTLKQIDGFEFDWRDNGLKSAGVIAQQLEKILPWLVSENDGVKSVNYSGLIAYLIQSNKELSDRIEKLENK